MWVCIQAAAPLAAQEWPTRPVTMVVVYPPGGAVDIAGRILAARLSEVLGQQVVVENVSGAAGMNGTDRVVRAAPDGYQFALADVGPIAISQTIHKKPLYNSATDLTPVGLIALLPSVVIARKNFPANNLQELAAYAKANLGRILYASSGTGGLNHLACTLLNKAIGANGTYVPYRGGYPGLDWGTYRLPLHEHAGRGSADRRRSGEGTCCHDARAVVIDPLKSGPT